MWYLKDIVVDENGIESNEIEKTNGNSIILDKIPANSQRDIFIEFSTKQSNIPQIDLYAVAKEGEKIYARTNVIINWRIWKFGSISTNPNRKHIPANSI